MTEIHGSASSSFLISLAGLLPINSNSVPWLFMSPLPSTPFSAIPVSHIWRWMYTVSVIRSLERLLHTELKIFTLSSVSFVTNECVGLLKFLLKVIMKRTTCLFSWWTYTWEFCAIKRVKQHQGKRGIVIQLQIILYLKWSSYYRWSPFRVIFFYCCLQEFNCFIKAVVWIRMQIQIVFFIIFMTN